MPPPCSSSGACWKKKHLTESLFQAINARLAERGLFLREGTIVDATLIAAPSSTKNQQGERDPEMHQSKKGNQWYFGMKAHIGVDAHSGLVHSVIGTAGHVADITQAEALLHGDETAAFGDAGYQGIDKRPESQAQPVSWHVAMRPGKRRALSRSDEDEQQEWLEQTKASIRAKVEHPFRIVKCLFGHRKVRYRGLFKNTAQLFTLFGLSNLVQARRWLLDAKGLDLRPEVWKWRRNAAKSVDYAPKWLFSHRTRKTDDGSWKIELFSVSLPSLPG